MVAGVGSGRALAAARRGPADRAVAPLSRNALPHAALRSCRPPGPARSRVDTFRFVPHKPVHRYPIPCGSALARDSPTKRRCRIPANATRAQHLVHTKAFPAMRYRLMPSPSCRRRSNDSHAREKAHRLAAPLAYRAQARSHRRVATRYELSRREPQRSGRGWAGPWGRHERRAAWRVDVRERGATARSAGPRLAAPRA